MNVLTCLGFMIHKLMSYNGFEELVTSMKNLRLWFCTLQRAMVLPLPAVFINFWLYGEPSSLGNEKLGRLCIVQPPAGLDACLFHEAEAPQQGLCGLDI